MAVPPLRFAMNTEKSAVTVTTRGGESFDLTAADMDVLIHGLVAGRAGMTPTREPFDEAELGNVLSHAAMRSRLMPEGDGSGDVLLGLFHPGLGWVGAHVRKADATRFSEAWDAARSGKAMPSGD